MVGKDNCIMENGYFFQFSDYLIFAWSIYSNIQVKKYF